MACTPKSRVAHCTFQNIVLNAALLLCSFSIAAPQPASAQSQSYDTLQISIDEAVAYALQHSPAVLAQQAAEGVAAIQAREKWSPLLPKVAAAGQYNRHLQKPVIFLPEGSPMGRVLELGSDNSYQASLSASLPIVAIPLYHGVRIGKVDQQIAQEQSRNLRIGLANDVRLAFAGVLLARKGYEVVKESMASAEATLAHVQRMAKQGIVPEYDLVRAQVQVANLRPSLVQAEQSMDAAELRLKSLMGFEEAKPLNLIGSLESIATKYTISTTPQKHNLTGNSTLRLLDLQQKRLQGLHRMAWAAHFPTLGAFFTFQYQTQANSFEFENYQWVKTSVVGLQLSIPLFEGLGTHYKTQQAKMGLVQLHYQRENAQKQLKVGLLVQTQQMAHAKAAMESAREAMGLAQKGLLIARTRYEAGAGTLLELTDADVALMRAALSYHKGLFDYIQAYLEQAKLQGQE